MLVTLRGYMVEKKQINKGNKFLEKLWYFVGWGYWRLIWFKVPMK